MATESTHSGTAVASGASVAGLVLNPDEVKDWLRVTHTSDDTLIEALIQAAMRHVEGEIGRKLMTYSETEYRDDFASEMPLPNNPLQSVASIVYVSTAGTTATAAASLYDVDTNNVIGAVRLAYGQTWPSLRGDPDGVRITYAAGYESEITFTNATELVSCAARTFTNGDIVRLRNSGGAFPTASSFEANKDYYVVGVATNDFQLSLTSGGAAITFTSDGTGTSYVGEQMIPDDLRVAVLMVIADMYENREALGEAKLLVNPTVERILWHYRTHLVT